MMQQTISLSTTDASFVRYSTAAADNPYFQTTATPDSLAALIRGGMIIRNADTPISFPFEVEEVTGVYRRAG
ncbi:hypothetical protein U8326_00040 [Tsuneonella sp. CC-YZS046]|uniref:hypothetical protein n=1 Tax=Tsuneonella sp. CC-YZS046 TaxID=3042152 RepID=UPI002D79B730|nr:hypothetical protein [Tsuneonella sp. CC-YZS046]WRO66594.1 hypothetical protein U8326_00040 [Tsuneonella sp. CC-YZS046]